jgi:hypothetical protein
MFALTSRSSKVKFLYLFDAATAPLASPAFPPDPFVSSAKMSWNAWSTSLLGSFSRALAFRSSRSFRAFRTAAILVDFLGFLTFGVAGFPAFFLGRFDGGFLAGAAFLVEVDVGFAGVRPVCCFGRPTGFAAAVAYVLACLKSDANLSDPEGLID